ncbi:hypothetical protein AB0F81_32545 [Actinoplanes sp. NPDC024001]|uniref:hypothetical protein n=1 Tax=Actinoplanes sp. NPDC024001 TaxID=3154598 RepID=UPI0033C97833
MSRSALRPVVIFAGVSVLAAATTAWAVADLVHEIGQPRCVSGRRVVSCDGGAGTSWIASVLVFPLLFAVVGCYLYPVSRLVRAEKAKRRDGRRSALRRLFGLVFVAAVALAAPAALLVRSVL